MAKINLENSNEIKGNDAIILNKLVPEYEKAYAQLKDLEETVKALKEQIISLSVAGVNKTNKVAWKRTDVEGYEKAIKLSAIKEKDLKFYNKLVEKGFTEFTKGSVRLTDITIL